MGENRQYIFSGVSVTFILLFAVITLWSCTAPQIVVIDDPLSAAEHNDLGVIYERKEMYDLAEKEYNRAVKKREDWAVPYFNLGNLYYKQGMYEKAERSYKKALHMDNNNPDVLNNLAYLLYERGRYEEAKALIEQALSIERKKDYLDTHRKILEKSPDN